MAQQFYIPAILLKIQNPGESFVKTESTSSLMTQVSACNGALPPTGRKETLQDKYDVFWENHA